MATDSCHIKQRPFTIFCFRGIHFFLKADNALDKWPYSDTSFFFSNPQKGLYFNVMPRAVEIVGISFQVKW